MNSTSDDLISFEIKLEVSAEKQLCGDILVECAPILEKIISSVSESEEGKNPIQNQGFRKGNRLFAQIDLRNMKIK